MRILKIMLIVLVVYVVSALLLSCRSTSDTVSEFQVVTMQRGDLTIDITAVGNLAFAHQEELAFEVGGTVGISWYWSILWLLSYLECLTSQSY